MQWEYWQNQDTKEVYGFDVSDPAQAAARDKFIATGNWINITGNWPLPPPPPTAEQNKFQAVFLLQETDWVNNPDVYNTDLTPHLMNRQDFIDYRVNVREFAVNPVPGNINWPTKPVAQWNN